MSLGFDEDSLCIRRLRVRAGVRTSHADLQLAFSRTLNSADVNAALLPEAILCVRRFAHPFAGKLTATSAERAASWSRAMREALRAWGARASRPARELVGANANAVLFANHAELLACLALDWLRDNATGRWWWQSLFPGLELADAVRQAWSDKPQQVPRALSQLHEAGQSSEFLRALSPALVATISRNVAKAFALEELHATLARVAVEDESGQFVDDIRPEHAAGGSNRIVEWALNAQTAPQAPWTPWVQIDPNLSSEARALLVLSVMLIRTPTVVRSLGFLRRVREYAEQRGPARGEQAPAMQRAHDGGTGFPARDQSDALPTINPPNPRQFESAGSVAGELNSSSIEHLPPHQLVRSASSSVGNESGRPSTRRQPSAHMREVAVDGIGCTVPPPTDAEARPEAMPLASDEPRAIRNLIQSTIPSIAPNPPAESAGRTEWGGVFYLVNLALALGLYGDFTQPRHPSLLLPVWDFLALMGGRLIGPRFEEDSLWDLFAILSGRAATERPGAWFEPPDEQLSLDAEAAGEQDQAEPGTIAGTPLERWVNRLAHGLAGRLARLLNQPDRDALGELVFHHAAEVRVNSERVTVCFCLAAHPLDLRMVGLDRDPGWVPAAGRAICFRYD